MSLPLRGQPDWGGSQERRFTGKGGSDLENAARNNWVFAPVLTGEVHYYEDFEASALHWATFNPASGGEVALDTTQANSGNQSCKLKAPTATNTECSIIRAISMPIHPRIGMGMYYLAYSGLGIVRMDLHAFLDNNYTFYGVKVDVNNDKIYIANAAGGWTEISTVGYRDLFGLEWYWLQMVVDIEAKSYVRVMAGSVLIDVTDLGFDNGVSVGADGLGIAVRSVRDGAANSTMYIDDLIITRNEE